MLARQLRPSLVVLALMTGLCGFVYPAVVTTVAQVGFADRADGSRISIDGVDVASSLIAQPFEEPIWFHPRPSATGYDAATSGGTNLGPNNPDLLAEVERRAEQFRIDNGLDPDTPLPVDAVTASGSGLDPHISVANASLQTARVAAARGLDPADLEALVDDHTDQPTFGLLGEARVNVVELNAALRGLER